MMQSSEEREDIHYAVFSELKKLGVKVPKPKKFQSSISKQEKSSAIGNRVFGVHLSDQEKIVEATTSLPKFIVVATSCLKKYTKKEIGLFRKAGSVSRQRDLRVKIENGESIEDSEPNDVASLLKQWLRELPESLIPVYLHDIFIRCLHLEEDGKKINALLLCCHLLPIDYLCTLKYLLNFLYDIAVNSESNKMDAKNLALIMAPNIFVMGSDSIDKSSGDLLQHHTAILELLINNAEKIGMMPICIFEHLLESKTLKNGTDLDSSTDALDYNPTKKRKKDLFSGIRKLVGQNSPMNPPKKGNTDERKSVSKRKANSEQLSMSPVKKPAIDPGVIQNEIMACTPKNTRNIFGTVKEKTQSAHSRRKSFGLLRKRKKESRQKFSEATPTVEPGINHDTLSPFQDKLTMSLKASAEPNMDPCFDESSPLLSTSYIDRILSKTAIVKKSLSDCCLTVPDEFKMVPNISKHMSQGGLHLNVYQQSPYNLRSKELAKNSSKHKLNISEAETKAYLKLETSNVFQSNLPSDCRKILEVSPVIKRAAREKEVSIVKDTSVLNDTKESLNEKNTIEECTNISMTESHLKSLNVFEVSNRRRSSRGKKNFECVIDLNESSGTNAKRIDKPEAENNTVRNEIKEKNCTVSGISESTALFPLLSTKSVQEESTKKPLINLQEASAVKLKNKSRNSLQRVGINPTSLSNAESETSMKNEIKDKNEATVSRSFRNIEGSNTLGRKHRKKEVRKGSIVRGRPNTVKTGLPLDSFARFNPESFGNCRILTSTSSFDNDLFINAVDHSEKNDDISFTSEFEKLNLSSPNGKHIVTQKIVQNCLTKKDSAAFDGNIKTVSERKSRDVIRNNSDSKIHNTRKRSSGVTRIKSFSDHNRRDTKPKNLRSMNRPRQKKNESLSKELQNRNEDSHNSPQKLTLVVNCSSPVDNKSVSNDAEKENLHIQVSAGVSIQVKTPDTMAKSPETWMSGREFLESQPTKEEPFNKRESIAMILNNKHGHVKEKVQLYDTRNGSYCASTPLKSNFSTPIFYDPQNSNPLNRKSQKRDSVRSNKVTSAQSCESSTKFRTRYYSPLPPPPKFVIPDVNSSSPKGSYPLKELTNINRADDISLNVSPAKDSFHTPLQEKSPVDLSNKDNHCIKPKRNSYSGRTPYRLPTVCRSESSPLITKEYVNKSQKKANESLSRCPSLANYFCSPALKTRSSLNIEKFKSDQLVDERNGEV